MRCNLAKLPEPSRKDTAPPRRHEAFGPLDGVHGTSSTLSTQAPVVVQVITPRVRFRPSRPYGSPCRETDDALGLFTRLPVMLAGPVELL
jgi:hypothetical protein